MIALRWQNPLTALIVNLVVSALCFSPLLKLCRHGQKKPSSWCQGQSCPETAGSPAAPWEVAVQSISLAAPPCCTTPWGTSGTRGRETRNKRSERGKIIQIISISTCSSPFYPFEMWHTCVERWQGVLNIYQNFPSIWMLLSTENETALCRDDIADVIFSLKKAEAARVVHSCNLISCASRQHGVNNNVCARMCWAVAAELSTCLWRSLSCTAVSPTDIFGGVSVASEVFLRDGSSPLDSAVK